MPHSLSQPKHASTPHRLAELAPLFEKHGIDPTPCNYRLWYEYVAGNNAPLKTDMDALIAAKTPFTDELQQDLSARHLGNQAIGEANFKASSRIADILAELVSDLSNLGEQTCQFDTQIATHIDDMRDADGLQNLEELLNVLAKETRHMRHTTTKLREDCSQRRDEIAEIQAELKAVKQAANSDPLTGLLNRRAMTETMTTLTTQAATSEIRHSLLMLDIDNFKAINDEHGHLIGDRVIRFVADVIRQNTKGQDTPCRYGGEEFAVLLPDTHLAGALTVAEKIRQAIAAAKLVRATNQQPIGTITISAGVATYRQGEDALDLVERADQSLYLAKERGRNKVVTEAEL